MASPQTVSEALPVEQTQPKLVNGDSQQEDGQAEESTAVVEEGIKGLTVSQEGEFALHHACAEGRMDDVREILSKGVEQLEALGELRVSL